MKRDTRPFYEVAAADVGKARIRAFGRTWDLRAVCGPLQPIDIGKRIYQVGEILQIENQEQRAARLAAEGLTPAQAAGFTGRPTEAPSRVEGIETQISRLWTEVRAAIDRAYASGADDCTALRDFTTSTPGGRDRIEELINREAEHERGHRRLFPKHLSTGIGVRMAAHLLVAKNISAGADIHDSGRGPSLATLLTVRDTAAICLMVGALVQASPAPFSWALRTELRALDYAAATNGRRRQDARSERGR
jgi:hypothetical protein